MSAIIYILYNANASVMGKMHYTYRKITAPANESPCAACDLTHNGLHLTETKEWAKTKSRIGAEVKQLHKDEANQEVILNFVKAQDVKYPLVLGQPSAGEEMRVIMTAEDLAVCSKDHENFLQMLMEKSAANGLNVNLRH
ncbi:MAG: hypothetical protein M1812_003978 [Candelaria pacifica]|nr:MAG: hypothetical protein M1812_003978 [Candelaria pacifica]